jgi:hypothetical protein
MCSTLLASVPQPAAPPLAALLGAMPYVLNLLAVLLLALGLKGLSKVRSAPWRWPWLWSVC